MRIFHRFRSAPTCHGQTDRQKDGIGLAKGGTMRYKTECIGCQTGWSHGASDTKIEMRLFYIGSDFRIR